MTRERNEDVVLIALVLSVAIHIGVMIYCRTLVMTKGTSGMARAERRDAMVVTRVGAERPDPVRIVDVEDVAASRDAPDVERTEAPSPRLEAVDTEADRTVPAPAVSLAEAVTAEPTERPMEFSAAAIKLDDTAVPALPVVPLETPKAVSADAPEVVPGLLPNGAIAAATPLAVPEFKPAVEALPSAPPASAMKEGRRPEAEKRPEFVPSKEVFDRVDEKVVEDEKRAVGELLGGIEARELEKSVNVVMTSAVQGGWTYFKLMFTPRHDLQVMPKDLVVLMDASGSIANDRLESCRKAARQFLRTCTNTGDRFNLVAFRDRYQYMSKTWCECDRNGFRQADRWLDDLAAHGRTDFFASVRSVLTLPRDPKRPLVAMVITDGDANAGVSETSQILSRFTALNGGLISVYIYGVKNTANRELIDVLTRGNRGDSYIHEGLRWSAGEGIEGFSTRFRDPVLSDLRIIFAAGSRADAFPRQVRNLYRGETLEIVGRAPADVREISFSIKGLSAGSPYEGFFKVPVSAAAADASLPAAWAREREIDAKLR